MADEEYNTEESEETPGPSRSGGNAMINQRYLSQRTNNLIHPSFPAMGKENKAHEGSQSQAPTKED